MDKIVNQPTPPHTADQSAPANADMTGRTIGDFRILRHLGQGGMGQVYLAEQISLKRQVALKLLKPELAANPTSLARFKAEAEAIAQATHANIVQVYFIGEQDGVPYMALEYVEGRNLREHLAKKGPPDVVFALSIMRQVAAALQRASEHGIIHRDIKPENILLTRKGEVKVTDFGLSRCLSGSSPAINLTQSGVTMGTPLYMSPEQVEGRPIDHRTDIYSFGVTCYHMLAGNPPYEGDNPFEVALKHVREEPKPLREIRPDLPEALLAVVHKMMAKDPAQRYQTCRDLQYDLARVRETLSGAVSTMVLSGADVSAGIPTQPSGGHSALTPSSPLATASGARPTASGTPFRRRGLIWLFIVSLLLAGAGGAGFAWYRRHAAANPPPTRDQMKPSPEDAAEIERIIPSHKHEQRLREAMEEYLRKDAVPPFGLCRDLGTTYLQNDRLDEADKLFTQVLTFKNDRQYVALGHLGRGIVLALRSHPEESNELLSEFVKWKTTPTILAAWLDDKRMNATGGGAAKNEKLKPWLDPTLRFLTVKALRYNKKNDLPDAKVPESLRVLRDKNGAAP